MYSSPPAAAEAPQLQEEAPPTRDSSEPLYCTIIVHHGLFWCIMAYCNILPFTMVYYTIFIASWAWHPDISGFTALSLRTAANDYVLPCEKPLEQSTRGARNQGRRFKLKRGAGPLNEVKHCTENIAKTHDHGHASPKLHLMQLR